MTSLSLNELGRKEALLLPLYFCAVNLVRVCLALRNENEIFEDRDFSVAVLLQACIFRNVGLGYKEIWA